MWAFITRGMGIGSLLWAGFAGTRLFMSWDTVGSITMTHDIRDVLNSGIYLLLSPGRNFLLSSIYQGCSVPNASHNNIEHEKKAKPRNIKRRAKE
jgi:hypothetical protein